MKFDPWDISGLTLLGLAVTLIVAGATCNGQHADAATYLVGSGGLLFLPAMYMVSQTFMRWQGSRLWQPARCDEAVRVAAEYYGIPLDELPRVYWQKDDPLCPYEEPGYFDDTRAEYVAGNWAPGALTIAQREGFSYARTALAVEMGNEADYRVTRKVYSDREYSGIFQERAEACRMALRKAGL